MLYLAAQLDYFAQYLDGKVIDFITHKFYSSSRRLWAAIFICLELTDALDHSANDADRELLDSSDQSSCHEVSHSHLELSKFLWHTAQPCELVNGAPFVLANEFIGQQELDGEGVCLALELARGEERAVRHEGGVDVWMQDGMAELMCADELQHRLV